MAFLPRTCVLALGSVSLAVPTSLSADIFRIPPATRQRLIQCSGANLASAMLMKDAAIQDDRILRSASFSTVIIEAEGADRKAVQDEVVAAAGAFTETARNDPQRAIMTIKACDAILGVGQSYTSFPAGVPL